MAANGTVLSPHTASPLLLRTLTPTYPSGIAKKVKSNGSCKRYETYEQEKICFAFVCISLPLTLAPLLDPETRGTLLTRTKAFKKLTKWAFQVCDNNHTGSINKTELYAGFLLVHLNLAKYAGPAACYVSCACVTPLHYFLCRL